jgi:hypothetical protein
LHSAPREFDNPINSLKWELRLLLAELQTNVQPFLAGKLAIKFAIRLFGFGEIAELSDLFLRASFGFAERNPRLFGLGKTHELQATIWDVRKHVPPS